MCIFVINNNLMISPKNCTIKCFVGLFCVQENCLSVLPHRCRHFVSVERLSPMLTAKLRTNMVRVLEGAADSSPAPSPRLAPRTTNRPLTSQAPADPYRTMTSTVFPKALPTSSSTSQPSGDHDRRSQALGFPSFSVTAGNSRSSISPGIPRTSSTLEQTLAESKSPAFPRSQSALTGLKSKSVHDGMSHSKSSDIEKLTLFGRQLPAATGRSSPAHAQAVVKSSQASPNRHVSGINSHKTQPEAVSTSKITGLNQVNKQEEKRDAHVKPVAGSPATDASTKNKHGDDHNKHGTDYNKYGGEYSKYSGDINKVSGNQTKYGGDQNKDGAETTKQTAGGGDHRTIVNVYDKSRQADIRKSVSPISGACVERMDTITETGQSVDIVDTNDDDVNDYEEPLHTYTNIDDVILPNDKQQDEPYYHSLDASKFKNQDKSENVPQPADGDETQRKDAEATEQKPVNAPSDKTAKEPPPWRSSRKPHERLPEVSITQADDDLPPAAASTTPLTIDTDVPAAPSSSVADKTDTPPAAAKPPHVVSDLPKSFTGVSALKARLYGDNDAPAPPPPLDLHQKSPVSPNQHIEHILPPPHAEVDSNSNPAAPPAEGAENESSLQADVTSPAKDGGQKNLSESYRNKALNAIRHLDAVVANVHVPGKFEHDVTHHPPPLPVPKAPPLPPPGKTTTAV